MNPEAIRAAMRQKAAELVALMRRANDAGLLTPHQWRAMGTVKQLAGMATNSDLKRARR